MGLTFEYLREALDYNEGTGEFTWARDRGRSIKAGTKAGTVAHNGYVNIGLKTNGKKKLYLAHRLAWFWMNGEWPDGEIDHINRNKADNRLSNLRVVTRSENELNKSLQSRNKAGATGVSFCKATGKWQVSRRVGGISQWRGRHACLADAVKAARL
jgi:hypothetical protein